MTKEELYAFIAEQKTAFISSIDADGYPCTRAMLMPRKIDGNAIYFSTNTSSRKRGRFKYQGVMIKGDVEVCTDQPTKDMIWRFGDKLFYKKGVADPDYCVLKFTGFEAEYYCDFKTEIIAL